LHLAAATVKMMAYKNTDFPGKRIGERGVDNGAWRARRTETEK
jgi:hypothetical protein